MRNLVSILLLTVFMFIICGVVYPVITTIAGQALFSYQANGSLLLDEKGLPIASEFIGQDFTSEYFFKGRPSQNFYSGDSIFTSEQIDFASTNSSVDNFSASNLEPYILYEDAIKQVPDVSKASGIPEEKLLELVNKYTSTNLTNEYVNVTLLNYEIYEMLN